MTHNHNDTPQAIFNAINGSCWKVSEVTDVNLKTRNSDMPACFSALICDFSQLIKVPSSKTTKTEFREYLQIYYLWHSVSKGPIWSFLETEILRKIGKMVKKSKKMIF